MYVHVRTAEAALLFLLVSTRIPKSRLKLVYLLLHSKLFDITI